MMSVGALVPLTGDGVTFGNDYRQLACGPLFAAGHINAANDSVVPSLKSLVGGSTVDHTLHTPSLGMLPSSNLILSP